MRRSWIVAIIVIAGAIFHFLPFNVPYSMCIPLATLTIASICRLPWQMTLAFMFSLLGDASACSRSWLGKDLAFLCQMGSFATAHIFFVWFFALQWSRKHGGNHGHIIGSSAIVAAIMIAAFTLIVPKVPAGVLRIGVSGYVTIISAMLFLALMSRDWVWSIAAMLFVYSDFILAWNLFRSPVPGHDYLILVPYFGAQLLFFLRTSSKVSLGYQLHR